MSDIMFTYLGWVLCVFGVGGFLIFIGFIFLIGGIEYLKECYYILIRILCLGY